MTSEQITELRKLHDGCIAQDLSAVASDETVTVLVYRENAAFLIACNNSIRQLLDERDALLKAAKEAAEGFDVVAVDDSRLLALLRDAIAKAESP